MDVSVPATDARTTSVGSPARSERRSIAGVLLLSLLISALLVALIIRCGCTGESLVPGPWWIAAAIALSYGLAEHYVFQIEYRREVISFSLSEVPTAFALAFLGPIPAIVARLVGSMLVIHVTRRPARYKIAFNSALFSFELGVAYLIVHGLVGPAVPTDGLLLVAVLVGIAISSFIGALLVSVAIASFEGDVVGHVLSEIKSSSVIGPLSATVAALALAPALIGIEFAVLSVLPVVVVWLVLVQYGRLTQRHGDLQALHGFAGVVGGSLHLGDVVPAALEETRRIMRAERAVLEVYDRNDEAMTWSAGPAVQGLPSGRNDRRWQAVFDRGLPVRCSIDAGGTVQLEGRHRSSAIVAPLLDDHGVLGLLVVADRCGVITEFDRSDVQRVVMLRDQLRASLRKALLHAGLEHAALHDALTGYWNRTAFEQEVTAALERPRLLGAAAVLMLDLDQFKEVNDTLGHHVGDQVLVEFARRVNDLLEPEDLLARFGGDEFAVFARRNDLADLRDFADSIVSESQVPLTLDGFDVVVTASVGIAAITDEDRDAAACLRRADIAMYTAKKHHAGFEVYREEIDRRTPERLALLGDLRYALEHAEMTVHYQPKIDLGASTVVGAEALVRWDHPRRGWVAPPDFIALAEETGLIRTLTDQVVDAAVGTVRGWVTAGHDLTVAVNLSTLDLLDELLDERIARRLEQHGVDPWRLTLEITESSLMVDTPRTMAMIGRLHRLGVQLSLDDFGTGFSSLSYLRRLPVTELKIDRTFVSNLLLDVQDEVIVKSTVDLGHNLGLKVVAEGIENAPVLDRLRVLGCDLGQGYGISRPVPADLFATWLATTEHDVPRTADRAHPTSDVVTRVR